MGSLQYDVSIPTKNHTKSTNHLTNTITMVMEPHEFLRSTRPKIVTLVWRQERVKVRKSKGKGILQEFRFRHTQ